MPIVPDRSGNNPGNPLINGWDGTDDALEAALWFGDFRTAPTTADARAVLGVSSGGGGTIYYADIQSIPAPIDALDGLTPAANQLPYYTGASAAALTTLSAFGRSLIDDGDAATARATLGVVIGTNVQAYSASLAQIAALADPDADRIVFWDDSAGAYTYLQLGTNLSITGTTLNASGGGGGGGDMLAANNLSDVANVATARSNLGLAIGTNVQAYDADLTTWAGLTPSANAQSLVTAANYAAMRTLLGLVIGTNVQAYDADLDIYASISPSANVQSLLGAANFSAMRTLLGLVIGTNVQAWDADLDALAGLTSAANKLPYFTGSNAASLADLSAFGRSLIDDADAATARATINAEQLGVVAGVDTKTANYTAVLGDAGKTIEMNVASANTFTVPQNSSVAYAVGTRIDIVQYGAGQTTITPDTSVTLRSAGGALKTRAQYSGVSIYKRATNEWVVFGDLTT